MDYIFKDCSDLYSVNLFNMIKSSDISARDIFSGCENVKFINLSNFDILYTNLSEANVISIFDNIPENIVYCINEKSILYSLLSKKNGSVLNCTYDWYKSQKKIISNNIISVNNSEDFYFLELKNISNFIEEINFSEGFTYHLIDTQECVKKCNLLDKQKKICICIRFIR